MKLVCPDDYDLSSHNYYYTQRDRYDLSLEELAAVGVIDARCRVGERIIKPLQAARDEFSRRGYRLIIKDGYRSPALYQLAYDKRVAKLGREHTESLLNMSRMIHASGDVVDIDLVRHDGAQLRFRQGTDGIPAHFYGFYKARTDAEAREFQANQDLLKTVMFSQGFKFGTLVEYWHFELPQ